MFWHCGPTVLAGWVCTLAFAVLFIAARAHSAPAPPFGYAPEKVLQAFKRSKVTLATEHPPRFLLHYRGPVAAFRGELCYRFAGYNQTCFRPSIKWLTPVTTIPLYAPANVPVELLYGYQLELTAPYMFAAELRYHVSSE